MVRLARLVVPGEPHHIIQRGNRRMKVFFSREDRDAYIFLLRKACQSYCVDIWAWCLMTNHVHCIAVPKKEDSLARCFADTHRKYTHRINRREGWKGHLWQARFGSSVLDEQHLFAALRYVERNPVRAGMVAVPWNYPWSSAAWHAGKKGQDPLIKDDRVLRKWIGPWDRFLLGDDDQNFIEQIRRESHVNRPVGSDTFIKELENKYETRLLRKRPGRPSKEFNN
jgi:putative transposase